MNNFTFNNNDTIFVVLMCEMKFKTRCDGLFYYRSSIYFT